MLKANYTSKETRDQEEPFIDKSTVPLFSSHTLENGRVHPIQAGVRLVEEARRRMKDRVGQNPVSPESGRPASLQEIYREVYEEVMGSCEGRDREEFVALCPKVTAMETSFYRWRKDAKGRREWEQGLFEGGKNEEDEVGAKYLGSINIANDAAPVVERDHAKWTKLSPVFQQLVWI